MASASGLKAGIQVASVAGKSRIELAKMGGITPLMFTLSGRWVDWPLKVCRPTTRLA